MKILDYNSRLKPMPQKGLCGDPEYSEKPGDLRKKVSKLAELIRTARHCVVFTGAGISTSSGIPDFRGPNGIWTKEKKGEKISDEEKTSELFDKAVPSFTHHAIVSLMQTGFVHHVVSQNVDGLHLRSGVPPTQLSELHGNIYMEICERCRTHYFRDHDVGGMGLQYTGKHCTRSACGGALRDFAVDWDTALPEDIFRIARQHMRQADLCICLGTSLRIRPAGNMPLSVLRRTKGREQRTGRIAVVNLQVTHIDNKCAVRLFHYCDDVLRLLCEELAVFVDISSPLVLHSEFQPGGEARVYSSPTATVNQSVADSESDPEDTHEVSVTSVSDANEPSRESDSCGPISAEENHEVLPIFRPASVDTTVIESSVNERPHHSLDQQFQPELKRRRVTPAEIEGTDETSSDDAAKNAFTCE